MEGNPVFRSTVPLVSVPTGGIIYTFLPNGKYFFFSQNVELEADVGIIRDGG
jgi:hypothetical protein